MAGAIESLPSGGSLNGRALSRTALFIAVVFLPMRVGVAAMSESQLLADILLATSRGNVRLHRQHAGHAWGGRVIYQDARRLILEPWTSIKLGSPGMSDLGGFVSEVITAAHVGQLVARYVGIEAKSARGRVTPEQLAFIDVVRRMGGRAGVARSVEEAYEILKG